MACNNIIKKVMYLLAGLIIAASGTAVYAQSVALKTNVLYDATATVNAGAEFQLAPRWSLDISGNLNAWTIRTHRWKHWLAQPEVRYWFCDAIAGHFVGLHALGGQYNFGNINLGGFKLPGSDLSLLKDRRYQGWYAGAGIAYGYSWILGKHWNLEAELGIGWIYTRFDTYPCTHCGQAISRNRVHNYVGPTKAAINLVYVF